jgi:hypothetical protein
MSSPHTNFDWADLDDGELVVPTQYAIAIYCNGKNDVCIRQESQFGDDEDVVLLAPAHAVAVAKAILRHAGYDDLAIVHVSRIIPQATVNSAVDDSDMAADTKPDKTAAERQRRRREKQRQRDGATEGVTERDIDRDTVTTAPDLPEQLDFQGGNQALAN